MNKQKETLRNKIVDLLEDPDVNWSLSDSKWIYCDISEYVDGKHSTIYVHYDPMKDVMLTVLRDYNKFVESCQKDLSSVKVLRDSETKVTYKGIDGEITHELMRGYLSVLTRLDVVNPADQWPHWPKQPYPNPGPGWPVSPGPGLPAPFPQDEEYEIVTTDSTDDVEIDFSKVGTLKGWN